MTKYEDRGKVLLLMTTVVVLIFLVRLFYVQVLDADYKQFAEENTLRKVTIYPARGVIYDRNGKVLVSNKTIYDVMVVPTKVVDLDTNLFCSLLDIDPKVFREEFKRVKLYSRHKPSPIIRQITPQQYGRFQEQMFAFRGFYVQARTARSYPHSTAAHLLGYLGEVDSADIKKDQDYYRIGDYIGIDGLEKLYEKELRGQKGVRHMLVDVLNREQGSYMNGKYDYPAKSGKPLITGIDLDLQLYGEKLMKGKRGSIVAIEPSTGEILALISAPWYDPHVLQGRNRAKNYVTLLRDAEKPLFNRATDAKYRPGSVFKLVQALVALQEGVIDVNTGFPCNRGIIGCHPHPSASNIIEGIQYSCNPYFHSVYRRLIQRGEVTSIYRDSELGFDKWRDIVVSFGLGSSLASDLPHVNAGFIPKNEFYDKWYGDGRWAFSTIYSNSIGEGELGVVPIQMANLAATIANRGYYITPHVVRAVDKKEDFNQQFTWKKYTKVSSRHFDVVIEGMQKVVEAGTARSAMIPNIIVCGKTGTVQKRVSDIRH